jgi:hypothetical protein
MMRRSTTSTPPPPTGSPPRGAPLVDVADQRGRRLARPTLVHVTVTDLLVTFPEPVGLLAGECVLVSLWLPNGGVHCLASIDHVRRSSAFSTEVTMTFEHLSDDDRHVLADFLATDRAVPPT